MITNATKDKQSILADWNRHNYPLIEGVEYKEVSNVIKHSGWLTELFRPEWFTNKEIDQVFKIALQPGVVSAWHKHPLTTDRLSIVTGIIGLVLFDDRVGSPTNGMINEFRLSELRPGTVQIPPGVWHGIQNLHHEISMLLNLTDKAYQYEDPDHWRIPFNDPQIPYLFDKNKIL